MLIFQGVTTVPKEKMDGFFKFGISYLLFQGSPHFQVPWVRFGGDTLPETKLSVKTVSFRGYLSFKYFDVFRYVSPLAWVYHRI